MKVVVIWQLRQQEAFDRAMELQFSHAPKKTELIEGFRQRLIESVTRSALGKPFKPDAEYTVKYGIQRYPYQKPGESASKLHLEEEWLDVRYKFIDDGTAEIVSVTSQTLPI